MKLITAAEDKRQRRVKERMTKKRKKAAIRAAFIKNRKDIKQSGDV